MLRICRRLALMMGILWPIAWFLSGPNAAVAQQSEDSLVVQRIRQEVLDRSAVIENTFYLTDVFGPRFVASPGLRQASEWAMQRLRSYGVGKVWQEPVPLPIPVGPKIFWSGSGWSVERFTIQQLTPNHAILIGQPVMLSEGTPGRVEGDAIILSLPDRFAAMNDPNDPEWNEFFVRQRGKLKGKILLIEPAVKPAAPADAPLDLLRPLAFRRYTPEDLAAIAQREPAGPPPQPRRPRPGFSAEKLIAAEDQLSQFLRDEGVVALIRPAPGANGKIRVGGPMAAGDRKVYPPATIELAAEHYNRLVRLANHGIPARIELELITKNQPGEGVFNTLAELPGSSKPGEVVMIGGHLDTMHIGTGATDNAVGCATLIEAIRILRTLDLKLDRTVRLALWSGEEHSWIGSRAYVQKHFVTPTGEYTNEHANLSAYLNLDAGAGQIRGIYVQGKDSLVPIFQEWLAPFADWGATTVSLRERKGSDEVPFVNRGLPGLPLMQDPLDYFVTTQHSNMDVLDHVLPYEQEVKRNAAIVAWLVYKIANAPNRLPR